MWCYVTEGRPSDGCGWGRSTDGCGWGAGDSVIIAWNKVLVYTTYHSYEHPA